MRWKPVALTMGNESPTGFIPRLKCAARVLSRRSAVSREWTVLPDDLMLVSYPKSGNTWLRFVVANLLHPQQDIDFGTIDRFIPDVHRHFDSSLLRRPRPRVIKSHSYFDCRYKRVIYVVRDPRDIAVSYYHHLVKRYRIKPDAPFEDYLKQFINGTIDHYGSWGDNVGSWLGAREYDPDFLLIRYEEMKRDGEVFIRKIAKFLNVQVGSHAISQVMEKSSMERMKELEKMGNWKAMKHSREDIAFVRSGTTGAWRNEISTEDAKRIEESWPRTMKKLGYLD